MSAALRSRWIFGPGIDNLAFGWLPLLLACAAWFISRFSPNAEVGPLLWLLLVACIDVGHVWSTLFRTYLNPQMREDRSLLLGAAPIASFGGALYLALEHPAVLWRAVAYFATFHFVRQQMGFMDWYNTLNGTGHRERWSDRLAVLAATVGPLLYWHGHLPRSFEWMQPGDYVSGLSSQFATWLYAFCSLLCLVWCVVRVSQGQTAAPRLILLCGTWLNWSMGMVFTNSDLAFTLTNTAAHGIPYYLLIARVRPAPQSSRIPGWVAVIGVAAGLALVEEFFWDAAIWHQQLPSAFSIELSTGITALATALLLTPQLTHYVLDGFIWRPRSDPSLAHPPGGQSVGHADT